MHTQEAALRLRNEADPRAVVCVNKIFALRHSRKFEERPLAAYGCCLSIIIEEVEQEGSAGILLK